MELFSLFAKISLDTSEYENGIDGVSGSSKTAQDAIQKIGLATETLDNKFGVLSARYASAQAEVDRLTEAFNKSANESGFTSEETQKLADELAEAEKKSEGLKGELDELTRETEDAGESAQDAGGKFSGFADKLKNGLAAAAKVGAAAMAAATAAVTAFAKASIDTGMQFDSSMSQVAATMGVTVNEIQELRDFAMEMGASTAFSANEAAQALNYMALAGYDAATSMEMLPTVLDLAAAGGIDLASASDMVTDAASALGLSIEETSEMVDKMAMASSKSNTSVAQLGEAILTVGGTAQNLAGGTTELSAAFGILADNGIKGAEGGTHLRNVILSLSAPTDTAAAALAALGVEVFDAEGNMRPLNEALGDLNDAMSGMTQAEQTNLISTVFNKTDIAAVNALLANTGNRWDELTGYIDDAAGAAEQMANTQLDNLSGDITLFKSALEGAQIVLSDQLTPNLREFVQFGSDAVSTLSTAFQEGGLTGAMGALGAVLSDGLNMVIEQLPQMVGAGMQLLGALGQGLIDNLPTITSAAVQIITMLATGLISALPDIASSAVEIITTLANGLSEQLPELIPVAIDAILQLVDTLTDPDNLSNLIDAALAIILALANGLIDSLPDLIAKAPEIVQNLVDAIVENAPKLATAALELITKLASSIIDNLPEIVAAGEKIINSVKEGLGDLLEKAKEWGGQLLTGLWNGIWDKVEWLKSQVSGVVDTIKSWFTGEKGFDEHSPSKWSQGVAAFVMDGLAIGFEDSKGKVMETVEDVIGEIKSRFDEISGFMTAKSDVGNLEYQLWERTEGLFATDAEKYGKKLDLLTSQQEDQTSVVEAAEAAYKAVVEQYGAASEESYQYQKTLLQEKLALQDLLDEIQEVNAARAQATAQESRARADAFIEWAKGDKTTRFEWPTDTVDFADSSLGKATAASINATISRSDRASGGGVAVAPVNLYLDSDKVASGLLTPLVNQADANGTPIQNKI